MSAHKQRGIVLIAARSREIARAAAVRHGWPDGAWRPLTYETHQAHPDAHLFVDASWADHPNAEAMQALIARRITIALGRRVGPASRSTIARTGE